MNLVPSLDTPTIFGRTVGHTIPIHKIIAAIGTILQDRATGPVATNHKAIKLVMLKDSLMSMRTLAMANAKLPQHEI